MEVLTRTSDAVTCEPLDFFTYLKGQDEKLYLKVFDHLVFEEAASEYFRLRKLSNVDIWDQKTKKDVDLFWWTYCLLRP
jgi:hypothetical protein